MIVAVVVFPFGDQDRLAKARILPSQCPPVCTGVVEASPFIPFAGSKSSMAIAMVYAEDVANIPIPDRESAIVILSPV